MKARQKRTTLLIIHLVTGGILGAFVYSPWGNNPSFRFIVQTAVFPILTISGMWMSLGMKIQKYLKRNYKSQQ